MVARNQEIAQNLKLLNQALDKKAKLIAVSKTHPLEDIRHAWQAGQRDFGENKVQELKLKAEEWKKLYPQDDIRWHFIGSLQSNKMNQLLKIPQLWAIHSLDSKKLVELFLKSKVVLPGGVFLQVNTSGEEQKGGPTSEKEVEEMLSLIQNSAHPEQFLGLMTLGKIGGVDYLADARVCFLKLQDLKKKLQKKFNLQNVQLSMGMSDDFSVALEVGTDYVRVGSKIFGARKL